MVKTDCIWKCASSKCIFCHDDINSNEHTIYHWLPPWEGRVSKPRWEQGVEFFRQRERISNFLFLPLRHYLYQVHAEVVLMLMMLMISKHVESLVAIVIGAGTSYQNHNRSLCQPLTCSNKSMTASAGLNTLDVGFRPIRSQKQSVTISRNTRWATVQCIHSRHQNKNIGETARIVPCVVW